MNRLIAIILFSAVTLLAAPALPCGGGFGEELELSPSQTIIVRHHEGEETYIFNPFFCGAAAEFGLILPMPSELTSEPALVENTIFEALETVSAPKIIVEEVCDNSKSAGDDYGDRGTGASNSDSEGGVDVVDQGRVGIFDWTLVKADTSAAFTDWLDANQYPYDEDSSDIFDYYVEKSWYFIAFKVTVGDATPSADSQICGTFGPIGFAFAADAPIVPARIAAAGSGAEYTYAWRLQILASAPMTAAGVVDEELLRYTGQVTSEQLTQYPAMASVAEVGDQLTSLDIQFYGGSIDEDIVLTPSSGPTEYRQTITRTEYIDCKGDGGCAVISPGAASPCLLLMLASAMLLLWRKKR